jgi:tRNA threonylcarbamoyl adenosine modification protein YeaZ
LFASLVSATAFAGSTAAASVCVLRADGEAFELSPPPDRLARPPAHARELMPAVASAMEMAGARWEDLEAIAVGVGPGSFTGVRMGLAAARAMAFALDRPLAGVSTLDALAAGAPGAIPVVDARRREVFALIEGRLRCLAPAELPPATLVGDGALRYRAQLEATGASIPPDDDPRHLPRARFHAALARDFGPPDGVEPIYVRVPDAERALAR